MSKQEQGSLPGIVRHALYIPAVAATSATAKIAIWQAPNNVTIEQVTVRTGAAITGDGTNTINLNILDGGAAGSGTTEIGNSDFGAGVNAAALDDIVIDCDSASLDEGDALILQVEKVGSGGTLGTALGSMVQIDYKNV